MRKSIVSLAVVSALSLTGCATIVSDSEYPVSFTSEPQATFTVTDSNGLVVHSGKTPQVVTLPASRGFFSGETYIVKYTAEGYQPTEVVMKSSVDGWIIGNILIGGIIGLVIDGATGAMFALPEAQNTVLQRSSSASASIQMYSYETLTAAQRQQLVRLN